jgi:hypothetical protein
MRLMFGIAGLAVQPALAGRPCGSLCASFSLRALRTNRPLRAWRPGFAGRARSTLWPRRRLAASRCRKGDEEQSRTEALTHGQAQLTKRKTHHFLDAARTCRLLPTTGPASNVCL